MEARLSQAPWLGGDDYSIADIATWPWAGKYHNYKGIELKLADFPNLSRWITAIDARPAYRRIHEFFSALFKEGLQRQRGVEPEYLDRFFGRGRYFRV